ncbi:MAG TPA: TolC family protein [Vicinamibacterales bacterium]|nr:TolC family protein [Vicinamibacterales bacterium]
MSIVLVAVVLTLITTDAAAQRRLSLADAQREARAAAPEVAELEARINGTEAIVAQAGRRLREDPVVASSIFRGELLGNPDEYTWSVGIRQPFDFSGSWRARLASANADVTRAQFDREAGLRLLDERVAVAVADLAFAQRQAARAEQLAALARIAADAAHQQFEVGTAPQIDADAADLDLAAALLALEQTRGLLAQSRTRLARLIGSETMTELIVEDPDEPADVPSTPPDFAPLVDRDPRVRAAMSEVEAARLEREVFERLARGPITFGLDYTRERREIPRGRFSGAALAGGLAANWLDSDLAFSVTVPLPLFNRQLEPRARATARILAAEATLRRVRADVTAELSSAWEALVAAARAVQSVSGTAAILDRDVKFVEQAVRAGQFNAITRVITLRRLEEAGRRLDLAVRDLRVARAAWARASGLP